MSLDRRSFLKVGGLAAAGVAAAAGEQGFARETRAAAGADGHASSSPAELVNVLQGTESTMVFSRGNTLPIAARPFGMAHWTLQSRSGTPWMFLPSERRLQGFRCTHQLSPWLGDYGHAVFLPFSGELKSAEPGARASSWRPEKATLRPHSLGLHLLRYRVDAELIPTERCAVISAAYGESDAPGFLFEVPGEHAAQPELDAATRTVRFTSTANEGGVTKGFATYYVMRLSAPWTAFAWKALRAKASAGVMNFAAGTHEIEVRIATSFISFEQAERNLASELGEKKPSELRAEGEAAWNALLNTVRVECATERQARTLYSCLYRTMLFPRVWHEVDASGKTVHRSPYNGEIVPGVMYADHGYWDVYRAWYPMMTLLFPERLAEILQSWVNAYKEGGWLPQFPCPGYRACMTGSLIDSVFGDAAAKGVKGFDVAAAYEGLKKHATTPGSPDKGYGRRGIEAYLKYGYAPAGLVDQAAAETVDAAYGDFCIAQVAKAAGHDADYAMFMKRSENWRHIFDAKTGFLRGKHADGSWLEPFDPVRWGDPYVEGAAWQHRWDVPHDLPGLIAAMGGREKAVAALDEMLTMAPEFNVGSYGSEIHEMSEMAAVDFGQYAHSNQPVHHVLYVYGVAGRRDKLAHWAHRVLEELYSPDGFAGDEDTGSMAAWYVLSALGFYPVCPGKAEYVLGQPLFKRATVKLPEGKALVVEASGQSKVAMNGSALEATVSHGALTAGGTLRFS